VVDSQSDRHVVQFTNERQNHVYATTIAIPAYAHKSPAAPSSRSTKLPPGRRSQSETGITRETTSGRSLFIPKNTFAISRSFVLQQQGLTRNAGRSQLL
jgi:hypothetical protein